MIAGHRARGDRTTNRRRVVGAGALGLAGVAAVLAVAPAAVASGAPTSTARTADPTPTPGAAHGSRATPAPRVAVSTDAPTSASTDGTTDASTTPADDTTTAVAPDFGRQKIRVGVQEKDGSYPPGSDTSGSEISIVEKDPSGTVVNSQTCLTDAGTRPASSTATYCYFGDDTPVNDAPDPANPFYEDYYYAADQQDTVTVTQTSNLGSKIKNVLVQDTTVRQYAACTIKDRNSAPGIYGVCEDTPDALFTDPGIPPTAVDDLATTPENTPVDVSVLANDDTVVGAPLTGLEVTQDPSHGSVTQPRATADTARRAAARVPSGPPFTYTPAAGFTGVDHFTYRLTDANGSATAVVTVTVTGGAASTSTAPGTSTATTPSASGSSAVASTELASTGTDDLGLLAVGVLLVVGGAATTVFGRRVRSGRHAV